MTIIKYTVVAVVILIAGVPLYALPATLSLKPGTRPGLNKLTIETAARRLEASGSRDWDLVEEARHLVAERMAYSRRNSFDTAGRAFERGYGYCTQHAYALSHLLNELGFEVKVVQAFQNQFPNGLVTAHAWVSVVVNGEIRYIDSLFYDQQRREIDFTPISEVTEISPAFKLVAFWGGTAVNAHRYYLSGKDF